MAIVDNLRAVLVRQLSNEAHVHFRIELPRRQNQTELLSVTGGSSDDSVKMPKETRLPAELASNGADLGSRAESQRVKYREPMSLEELADILRKVNLTFDLFEVQAKFQVDLKTGEVTVQVINQRTGEVIRKIPPYDLPDFARLLERNLQSGQEMVEPVLTDMMV